MLTVLAKIVKIIIGTLSSLPVDNLMGTDLANNLCCSFWGSSAVLVVDIFKIGYDSQIFVSPVQMF